MEREIELIKNLKYCHERMAEAYSEIYRLMDKIIKVESTQIKKERTVVYKDGSFKVVEANSSWEFENDPDYLVTI